MVSKRVSASASGSASTTQPAAPSFGLQDPGGIVGGRSEPRGFAAALGRCWRVAHNSTGPTTAERGLNLTRKRSGLHLINALLRSYVSGPPLAPLLAIRSSLRNCSLGLRPQLTDRQSRFGKRDRCHASYVCKRTRDCTWQAWCQPALNGFTDAKPPPSWSRE